MSLRVIVLFLVPLSALAADPKLDPAAVEHFEKRVRPVLVEHCGKCHIEKAKGGLKLGSRAALLSGGDTGPAVVPGDAAKSLLVQTLKYDGELKMPPAGQLPQADIDAIEKWVKSGAVWPGGETKPTPTRADDGPLFTAEEKAFWAFQPVIRPELPKLIGSTSHAIDAFVLAKLELTDLSLSKPAEKRTLLRRVYFDLIGLPPTPDELTEFEKDESPDAFEKVIDRLLASRHYGERWGRHWLDVARYADSNGMDENTLFGNAWRYRDYVVNSLNADKPYDQFLREQIAGDLLPPSDDERVQRERYAALGFLALGPKLLAEPDKQKMLLDIADEQLDTVGKSALGLTFGCARCHDHKFDPIPTRDYYSLLAIFTSTRTMVNLNTVAKTFERTVEGAPSAEVVQTRATLDKLRREVRQLEKQFGQTPESNKDKRQEIHIKAEAKRAEIQKLEASLPQADLFLGVEEGSAAAYGTAPRNLHVQIRGNYTTPGDEAPAIFPRILAGEQQPPFVASTPNPANTHQPNKTAFGSGRSGSGRLELANWLTDSNNPLTARVIVNRIWLHHFGEGLVRTPDNFGRLGERPTHPKLLDWLAAEFVHPTDGGTPWSFKRLHKLILLSRTYRQSGGTPPDTDPENRYLSCFPRRRLDAESIRDAMLATSGNLDRTLGGSLHTGANLDYVRQVNYESNRRSIYLPVIRGKLFPFFQVFDFPDPGVTVGQREVTTVAPQALFLMNNPFVTDQATRLAERVLEQDAATRPGWLYRQTLLRDATREEDERVRGFVSAYSAQLATTIPEPRKRDTAAWSAAAQALLASSEFLTVE